MATYTYEIAFWQASDALKNDLGICRPAIDVIKRHTSLPIFAGVSEDGRFSLAIGWESIDAHRRFIAHPDYQTAKANFAPLFPEGETTGPTILHTHFGRDPLSMFVAPTTELVFLAPKDGVTLDELRGVLTLARERLSALPEDIALDGVLGEAEERPNQLLLLVGWESLEAHLKYISPGGPVTHVYPDILPKVKKESTEIEHIPYTRFA